MGHPRFVRGLSLPEMLVCLFLVITLIALLFPTIRATRANARVAACRSSLYSIGTAFHDYAARFRGYYPMALCSSPSDGMPDVFPNRTNIRFWMDFLSESVEPSYGGTAGSMSREDRQRQSIFWRCPDFDRSGSDYAYGMNPYPNGHAPTWFLSSADSVLKYNLPIPSGRFARADEWRPSASRALIADAKYAVFRLAPRQVRPDRENSMGEGFYLDLTRHRGRAPINMLFADGHVDGVDLTGAKAAVLSKR